VAWEKVLISPQWIERVSWSESAVFINLSRETIKESPEYTEESLLTRDYEIGLQPSLKSQRLLDWMNWRQCSIPVERITKTGFGGMRLKRASLKPVRSSLPAGAARWLGLKILEEPKVKDPLISSWNSLAPGDAHRACGLGHQTQQTKTVKELCWFQAVESRGNIVGGEAHRGRGPSSRFRRGVLGRSTIYQDSDSDYLEVRGSSSNKSGLSHNNKPCSQNLKPSDQRRRSNIPVQSTRITGAQVAGAASGHPFSDLFNTTESPISHGSAMAALILTMVVTPIHISLVFKSN